ncbi:MAG: L,D-transpeptidase family protein [Thermodesulfobacteriota bacterium]
MQKRFLRYAVLLLGWLTLLAAGPADPVFADPDAEMLRRIRSRISAETKSIMAGASQEEMEDVIGFYALRQERRAWTHADGWSDAGREAIACIGAASRDGLDPEQYHYSRLLAMEPSLRNGPSRSEPPFDWDLLLTHGLTRLLRHLSYGRVNPDRLDDQWSAPKPASRDIASLAASAADSGRVREVVEAILPTHPGYARLREALVLYRDIQRNGGWPLVPSGDGIRPGESDPRIPVVRRRMAVTDGPLPVSSKNPNTYDTALIDAVKRFQVRNGIAPDGVLGSKTIQAMNVPVENRIQQILLNLERWRWLGQDWGKRYIAVNIANYSLEAVEDGKTLLNMRVVVGQTYRRTPVFSERLRYIILNPYWNVPKKIAVEDKLPLIKKDPGYLIKNRIHVFSARGEENGPEINPYTIDWSKLHADYFPYRLKQDPGDRNALGRIKFLLPNKYAIYLHDSPQRELFRRTSRGFSSGCIRLEKPIELAVEVMKNVPEWNRERILQTIQSGITTVIPVKESIMVHLLYWTAWADEQGVVHFREDIYDRDRPLWVALQDAGSRTSDPKSIFMGELVVQPGSS